MQSNGRERLSNFAGGKIKKMKQLKKRYPIVAAIILLLAGYFGWYENDQRQDNLFGQIGQVVQSTQPSQTEQSRFEVRRFERSIIKNMALRWDLHQPKSMKRPQLPLYPTAEHSISWKKKMEMMSTIVLILLFENKKELTDLKKNVIVKLFSSLSYEKNG